MYHIFLIHSLVEGNLGCFQVLGMTNNAAMNIVEQMDFKELLTILSHQGYANQNYSEVTILHWSEWPRSETLMTAYVGEDAE